MVTCLKSYKDTLLNSKWDSFRQIQEMQIGKMSENVQQFKNSCVNKVPEFLAPFVAKMQSLYLAASQSIQLKFEHVSN